MTFLISKVFFVWSAVALALAFACGQFVVTSTVCLLLAGQVYAVEREKVSG